MVSRKPLKSVAYILNETPYLNNLRFALELAQKRPCSFYTKCLYLLQIIFMQKFATAAFLVNNLFHWLFIKFKLLIQLYLYYTGEYHFNYLVALVLYYTVVETWFLGVNVYCNSNFCTNSTFTINVTNCVDTFDMLWKRHTTIFFHCSSDYNSSNYFCKLFS